MLCHDNLINMYYTNFNLMQHHQYSLTEIENMIPFERQIYLQFLHNYLEEEKQRINEIKNNKNG